MKQDNKYHELLKIFTGGNDIREWMRTPFLVGDKVCATDGKCIIAVPKFTDEFKDRTEKTKGVYPLWSNCNTRIELSKLRDAIANVPLLDCYDENETTCGACSGEGEVEFEFDYNCQSYYRDIECPVCEGQGIGYEKSKMPNGKKEMDLSGIIVIGKCSFLVSRILELIKVIETLELTDVFLINQTEPNKANLFKLSDVELLISTCIADDAKICAII